MKLEKSTICTTKDYGFEDIEKILSMISGKWKLQIIYHLSGNKNIRYGQLKKKISTISYDVSSAKFKYLAKDGLISRIEYDKIVPRVEYLLTYLGISLLPVYAVFSNWYNENKYTFSSRKR